MREKKGDKQAEQQAEKVKLKQAEKRTEKQAEKQAEKSRTDYISHLDYINHYDSPLGGITLASDGDKLTGLWFDGQKYYGFGMKADYEEKDLPVFDQTKRWLDIYFQGRVPDFMPALELRGTDFRKRVWQILLTIPYGETMTYGQIAEILARGMGLKSMSAQAVGGAVSHNSLSIIVPCHRVLGSDGSLTGYAGGLDKKIRLLELEQVKFKKD